MRDFPAGLARVEPVADINDAVIYTMGEPTSSDYGLNLAGMVGSEMIIRGWFKWRNAPPVREWADLPPKARALGARFGGGITCSALDDKENNITREQLLDMATRGPDGELVDAWGLPGTRHGSLSSPAYLDYLFRWCREQIDAGVDYLLMDEINAALSGREGFDDYSLADFRRYLLKTCPATCGWKPDDLRWQAKFGLDLSDAAIFPDHTIASLDYRAYLKSIGCVADPHAENNRLRELWAEFQVWRDDRAWKELTARIRAYAAGHGCKVWISANGIAPYVDLQVIGVWSHWRLRGGHVDLSENQLPVWRSIVAQGHERAGRVVPVVLFHDWGLGDPPFPWMAVPLSEREIWMRTRGAEIYVVGAYFAFPVLSPGYDASKDGLLACIQHQTIFYKRHRDIYREARYVGSEGLASDLDRVSLGAAWRDDPKTLYIHLVNREVRNGVLVPRAAEVTVPVGVAPTGAVAVSPDWRGEKPLLNRISGGSLMLSFPAVEAYAVAQLRYDRDVDLSRLIAPMRTEPRGYWSPVSRTDFVVLPNGLVEHAGDLNAYLQGMLHPHLRGSPTFLVNAVADGALRFKVRAVAALGARLEYRIDGQTAQIIDLPDKDGKSDGDAAEYDKVFELPIPAGRHRLTIDNVGGDWVTLWWYELAGKFETW